MSRYFEALKSLTLTLPTKPFSLAFYDSFFIKTSLIMKSITEEEIFHYIKAYKKIRNSGNG